MIAASKTLLLGLLLASSGHAATKTWRASFVNFMDRMADKVERDVFDRTEYGCRSAFIALSHPIYHLTHLRPRTRANDDAADPIIQRTGDWQYTPEEAENLIKAVDWARMNELSFAQAVLRAIYEKPAYARALLTAGSYSEKAYAVLGSRQFKLRVGLPTEMNRGAIVREAIRRKVPRDLIQTMFWSLGLNDWHTYEYIKKDIGLLSVAVQMPLFSELVLKDLSQGRLEPLRKAFARATEVNFDIAVAAITHPEFQDAAIPAMERIIIQKANHKVGQWRDDFAAALHMADNLADIVVNMGPEKAKGVVVNVLLRHAMEQENEVLIDRMDAAGFEVPKPGTEHGMFQAHYRHPKMIKKIASKLRYALPGHPEFNPTRAVDLWARAASYTQSILGSRSNPGTDENRRLRETNEFFEAQFQQASQELQKSARGGQRAD